MYLTEEEARAKWCPFSRTIQDYDGNATVATVNRGLRSDRDADECRCLASGCMAWRWLTVHEITGWCGLAAKPDEAEQAKSDVIEERELDDEIGF